MGPPGVLNVDELHVLAPRTCWQILRPLQTMCLRLWSVCWTDTQISATQAQVQALKAPEAPPGLHKRAHAVDELHVLTPRVFRQILRPLQTEAVHQEGWYLTDESHCCLQRTRFGIQGPPKKNVKKKHVKKQKTEEDPESQP